VGSVSAVSVIAIGATVGGDGPFAVLPPGVGLLALRVFIGSLALTALLVAAEVGQHQRLEWELYHARKTLQRLLRERTAQLDATNSLATVGTWTFDVGSEKLVWSEEMYRILGYAESRFPVVLSAAFERMEEPDRAAFLAELRAVLDSAEAKDVPLVERRYQVVLPDGGRRTVRSQLTIAETTNGRATRIRGMLQDITERQRLEDELRRLKVSDESGPQGKELSMWMLPWMKDEKS